MGRTNGKLVPFLKNGLQNNTFFNLKWQDENSQIFAIKLPRYEKKKGLEMYEKLLMEWYAANNRTYYGYSQAKAVLQAALKKSPYIVTLSRASNGLHFRFATKEEEREKRSKQATKLTLCDPLHQVPLSHESEMDLCDMYLQSVSSSSSPNPPPSDSSGYISEDLDDSISMTEEVDMSEKNDVIENFNYDDLLKDPSFNELLRYVDSESSNDVIKDTMGTGPFSANGMTEHSTDYVAFEDNISLLNMIEDKSGTVAFENDSVNAVLTSPHMIEVKADTAPFKNDSVNVLTSPHMIEGKAGVVFESASVNAVLIQPNMIEVKKETVPFQNGNLNAVPTLSNVVEGQTDTVPFDGAGILNDTKITQPFNEIPGKPVIELTPTEVNSPEKQRTYWLCTKKLQIGSVLELICEKQIIQNEHQGFSEGMIYLNDVLERGGSYSSQQTFEIDGMLFLFLKRNY